jgi:hypothetical protein
MYTHVSKCKDKKIKINPSKKVSLGVVVYACNLSTLETKVGGWKFKASLGFIARLVTNKHVRGFHLLTPRPPSQLCMGTKPSGWNLIT